MSEDKKKLNDLFSKAFANQENNKEAKEEKQEQTTKDETNVENSKEENETELIKEDVNMKNTEEELKEELVEELNSIFEEEMEEQENEELDSENPLESNSSTMIKIEDLEDYPDQPFKVYTEDKESEMIDSIRVNGIIQDLIVRPLPSGKYQILAGHNRKNCAKKAGLTEVPCQIKDVDDDTAKLILIDTNLVQRKDYLPSEFAKALQIKKEVYAKNSVKSDFFDEISKEQNMSRGNIQRYLRLNFLTDELMTRVDNKEIGVKTAEDLSFLKPEEQNKLEEFLQESGKKVTIVQARKLKEESEKENFNADVIKSIMAESKKQEEEEDEDTDAVEIKFSKEELDKYFENFEDIGEIKEFIISILEDYIKVDTNG